MLQFALVLNLFMGTWGRHFHCMFSIKLSVLEQNSGISNIVLRSNANSELCQTQRRPKWDNKKSKRFNKQNKNSEDATHFLCRCCTTYVVKLDGNGYVSITLISKIIISSIVIVMTLIQKRKSLKTNFLWTSWCTKGKYWDKGNVVRMSVQVNIKKAECKIEQRELTKVEVVHDLAKLS